MLKKFGVKFLILALILVLSSLWSGGCRRPIYRRRRAFGLYADARPQVSAARFDREHQFAGMFCGQPPDKL